MIKYGLISETDARTLEKTIDLICKENIGEEINITEIGIFDGQTARGLYEYTTDKAYLFGDYISEMSKIPMNSANFKCNYTAIDNEKDKLIKLPFPECKFIRGNSNEVYNQIPDNSQHLIVIDGNHSFPYVVCDYYCYESKVKQGGYLCFHDIKPSCQGLDWQRMGKESDPDMSIAVRKALTKIGLLNNEWIGQLGWTKVFEEWDENDRCGGFVIFKKLY